MEAALRRPLLQVRFHAFPGTLSLPGTFLALQFRAGLAGGGRLPVSTGPARLVPEFAVAAFAAALKRQQEIREGWNVPFRCASVCPAWPRLDPALPRAPLP